MKILDNSPAYSAAQAMEKDNKGSAYDKAEKKILVRFEKGIDFDNFEDFQVSFIGILRKERKKWGRRQIRDMERLGYSKQIEQLDAKVQAMDIGIPENALDMNILHERVGNRST